MLNWREGGLRFDDDLAFLSAPVEIKSDLKKGETRSALSSDCNSPLFADLALHRFWQRQSSVHSTFLALI